MCGPCVTSLQLPPPPSAVYLTAVECGVCFDCPSLMPPIALLYQSHVTSRLAHITTTTPPCHPASLVMGNKLMPLGVSPFGLFVKNKVICHISFFTVFRIYRPRGATASQITFSFHQESPVGDQQGIIASTMFSLHVQVF